MVNSETMIPRNKEVCICAAIWYKDIKVVEVPHQPTNINRGFVLCGWRHGSIIALMKQLTGLRTVKRGEDSVGETIQGFLTNKNRFVDRNEGREIQLKAGHPVVFEELYSEDLY